MGEIEHHYKKLIIIVITAAIICNLASAALGNKFRITTYALAIIIITVMIPEVVGIMSNIVYWNRKK